MYLQKFQSEENWRLYQSESATLTIKCAEGYKIKSITINYTTSKTGCLKDKLANTYTSGDAYTVNGTEVVFTVGNTGTATNGQARVTIISVTYVSVGTLEEPEEKEYEIQYNGVEDATHENPTTYKEEDLPFDLKDAYKKG